MLALVEKGSFRQAAEVLRLGQPALSKSIQQLERRCGVRPFDRRGKRVVPTGFGTLVAETARQVIDAIEGLVRTIDQTKQLEASELSVGAGPYAAEMWLGQVTGRILKRYSGLRFKLRLDHWRVLPELLVKGQIDLFVANVDGILGQKAFRIVEFPAIKGLWVCGADHRSLDEEGCGAQRWLRTR